MSRESMQVDCLIIGAGPAGLACAIRFKQLCQQHQVDYSVCILEKAASVGGQILSGAVIEPRALNELLPDWQNLSAPITTAATEDRFLYLSKNKAYRLPTPPQMHNQGNYIVSLANVCRWLGEYAENLGVEIYPGFAGTEVLYNDADQVYGIATGDMGRGKDQQEKSTYQPGMELHAKQTVIAEGCRGSLSKQLIAHYQLDNNCQPQSYGIGIKELWQIDRTQHQPGLVIHIVGWPLDHKTYGGSFLYHFEDNQVALGFVVGLDYQNPYLNPFMTLQQFKTHPAMQKYFIDGKRIGYGARALNESGWQAIPDLAFPGGVLIGCSAGFLNVAKIKGSHTAMKSGMLAAETIFAALQKDATPGQTLFALRQSINDSWIADELYQARNIRPGFHKGLWPGLIYAAIDTYVLRGKAPWTFRYRHADYQQLKPAQDFQPIHYPKPDNKITFDKLSSVYLANLKHEEDQPVHLQLQDPKLAIDVNYQIYHSPEQYYCPAGVYEIIVEENQEPRLQINAQNCVHCKTCDIKDPRQNINWIPPEGGSGPNYGAM